MNSLRQRLENLSVGRKLLAALLVLMATVLLIANLAFISAAYWISQESMAPQALQTLGRLFATAPLSREALASPESARRLLDQLDSYAPLRAAALYDGQGELLAQLISGSMMKLPQHAENCNAGACTNSAPARWWSCPRTTARPATCCWWPPASCPAPSTPGPSPPAWRSWPAACCSGCWWHGRSA